MAEIVRNNPIKKESHSQFENEPFFHNYFKNFTDIEIKIGWKFKENFFDKDKKILYLPNNPSLKEVEIIILFLNKFEKYNLWKTAKKRFEEYKSKIKREALTKQNNFENNILRESLYEEGKKYVLEHMKMPKSDILLKDWLDLEKLSKNFESKNLREQKEEINKILNILYQYENANIKWNDWWIPMKFVKNKKLFCVWFSYLADIIFEKLNVKHYVASGIIIWWKKQKLPHSVSIIKLKWKYYLFDPVYNTYLVPVIVKNNIIDFRNKKGNFYNWYIFTLWDPEKEVLAQNLRNIALDLDYDKRISLLKDALKLSPNNIIILNDLKKYNKIFYKKYLHLLNK